VTLLQRLRRKPLFYLWLPVAAWMGLIFYLSAPADLPHPQAGWMGWLFSSGAHALEYGVLAVLWRRALGQSRRAGLLAFALAFAYALSDEFHQSFVPGRHPDVVDLACDALGAALGLGMWAVWHRQDPKGGVLQL
jgi:VanZ family protein